MSRTVDYLPLDSLTADPRNPKAHDEELIDASIGRFGILDLIVKDGRTGYIVSGHGRTKALRAMYERGETAPEGVQIAEDGSWFVPVTVGWSSRTDTEAAAALIALNRSTEAGGWVDDQLLELLDTLSAEDDGLIGVGYSTDDIEALTEQLNQVETRGASSFDNVPTERHDFGLHEVVVTCEDSTEQERVLTQLMELGLNVTTRTL